MLSQMKNAARSPLAPLAAIALATGLAWGQPILQGRPWVRLESYNFPNRFIRHRNYLGELTPVESTLDRLDSSFRIVRGLAGTGTISFESKNFPTYYLRHHHFRIKLHKLDSSPLFRQDASFKSRSGLALGLWNVPLDNTLNSYESVNYPGFYIRHRADNPAEETNKVFHLYLDKYVRGRDLDSSRPAQSVARFRRDATFRSVSAEDETRVLP